MTPVSVRIVEASMTPDSASPDLSSDNIGYCNNPSTNVHAKKLDFGNSLSPWTRDHQRDSSLSCEIVACRRHIGSGAVMHPFSGYEALTTIGTSKFRNFTVQAVLYSCEQWRPHLAFRSRRIFRKRQFARSLLAAWCGESSPHFLISRTHREICRRQIECPTTSNRTQTRQKLPCRGRLYWHAQFRPEFLRPCPMIVAHRSGCCCPSATNLFVRPTLNPRSTIHCRSNITSCRDLRSRYHLKYLTICN